MRLFLFLLIASVILFFMFVLYCLLRIGAEEDRRMEEYMRSMEKDEK